MYLLKHVRLGFLGFVFALGVVLIGYPASHVSAATCNFASQGTNDFNTAANWDCGFVPGASSTAVLPAATSTSLSGAALVNELLINTNATMTTTGFSLTVQGTATSSGILIGGGNTISIGDDLVFLSGFTFTPGTGTLTMASTTGAVGNAQRFIFPSAVTFNNFDASSTRPIQLIGSALVTVGGNFTLMGAQGTTLTSGATMAVTGTTYVSSTGLLALTDSTNAVTFTATTTNAGTMAINNGAFTFNGDMTNLAAGVLSETAAQTGTFTFGRAWNNAGTFTSGSSTAVLSSSSAQQMTGDFTFYNLQSEAGTKTFSGNVTTTGDVTSGGANNAVTLSVQGGRYDFQGNINTGAFAFTLSSATSVATGGRSQTLTASVATLSFPMLVEKTAGTTLTVTVSALTLPKLSLVSGTLSGGASLIAFTTDGYAVPFLISGGTFTPGTSEIRYAHTSGPVAIATTTYYALSFVPGDSVTYTLDGNVTTTGSINLGNSNVTLNLAGFTLVDSGTFTNSGLVTLNAGKIVHTAESVKVTNSSGVETATFATGDLLFVTVQDSNRNLASSTAETMTVTIAGNSAAGSDSETLTLTETGVATGIFRNSTGLTIANSTVASTGNGQFEVIADGVGTGSYTDNQDSADSGSDTATLTYTAASVTPSSGGGGGGGGYIPITVTSQTSNQNNAANLTNLTNIGVSVHNLVKLPNDGDASTQYDSAVYYVGSDGKRHAFPNDKVYFTWYTSFDGVQIINQAQLASIPLGSNVTYKPGVKMVKFTTDSKVYVVAKGGVLHGVSSEAAAAELYGANWNTKIDDISDAFYTNYLFGTSVTGLVDFNPTTVTASVSLPSDSLQM